MNLSEFNSNMQSTLIVPSKNVKLTFSGLHSLWAFIRLIDAKSVVINTEKSIVDCNCTEEDINLAIRNFKAKVVEDNTIQ